MWHIELFSRFELSCCTIYLKNKSTECTKSEYEFYILLDNTFNLEKHSSNKFRSHFMYFNDLIILSFEEKYSLIHFLQRVQCYI